MHQYQEGGDFLEKSSTMTKGQMKSFTCPVCGWMVKSPLGEDDIVEHASMHGKEYHADMPMTEEQIRNMIK